MEENMASSTPPPTEEQQPPQNPQPPAANTSSDDATASSSPPPTTIPNPNPTPAPKPPTATQSQQSASQTRPPFNTRPWQQPPHSHFTLPSPPPASSASISSSVSAPAPSRGGIAVGVPAHNPSTPPPPSASFSSLTSPAYVHPSQIRQPMQGTGMTGTTSSMRPGAPSHQLRPPQSHLRPPTTSAQSPASQNFQGGSMLRASTLGSSSLGSAQSTQPQNQPWLSSGTHGKPPLPTSSLRPQTSSQSFQQRSHISQHNLPTTSQQQPSISTQKAPQASSSAQSKDHSSSSQSITRVAGLGTQRQSLSTAQFSPAPGSSNKNAAVGAGEPSNRILSKRSIQDILKQIDPTEKLDPGVEDILVDIAEDFVDSVTTFGCALARHRKSSTLEAKDILLHLEKNWYMTIPGYGGDEIKTYKKPVVLESHKERLAAIKKSTAVTEAASKSTGGASAGNTRGHSAKGPVIREAA